MTILYMSVLVVSLILSGVFFFVKWRPRFNLYSVVFYTLIPVANLGYVMFALAESSDGALAATKIIYLGGCYLSYYMMLCIMWFCGIKMPKAIVVIIGLLVTIFYSFVVTAEKHDLFYKSYELVKADGMNVLRKDYGIVHAFFYPVVLLPLAVTLAILIYTFFRKKDISRKNLILLFVTYVVAYVLFFGGKYITGSTIELAGISYVIFQFVFLLLIDRMSLYDIGGNVMETLMFNSRNGYISLDKRFRYLGSDPTARSLIPALNDLSLDDRFTGDGFKDNIRLWMREYFDGNASDLRFKSGDRIYNVNIRHLIRDKKRVGYHITLEDITREQQYIDLLNNYNSDLKDEVAAKTEHIEKMHDNLILGMAMMVESRDNSTGGHIRRTSDCIKILLPHIRRNSDFELDDEFCRDLIKAAPMHDLGKIAVDDRILRKPGRFEPEEFEIMKTHAAKGAELITKILEETDDERFREIAVNVAHYHHERVDGTGYPDGLKGDEIPLEARIMAVVDVYDALVSKRCYKESMSFEQAYGIIYDGMGKHFDARLKDSFVSARPDLEAYYS